MNRIITGVVVASVAALAVGCSSSTSDPKPSASATTARPTASKTPTRSPSPTPSTSTVPSPSTSPSSAPSPSDTPMPSPSTAALRGDLIGELGQIDSALISNQDRAVRRAVSTCADILAGKSAAVVLANAKARFTGGDIVVDDNTGKQIVSSVKTTFCL